MFGIVSYSEDLSLGYKRLSLHGCQAGAFSFILIVILESFSYCTLNIPTVYNRTVTKSEATMDCTP